MNIELLDRTRRITRLLHDNHAYKLAFTDICKIVGEELHVDVFVISQKGKLLGMHTQEEPLLEDVPGRIGDHIYKTLNERFLNVLSTKENVNLETMGFAGKDLSKIVALISPIIISGDRLGTLFMYRSKDFFGIDDIIFSEYSTTVVGLEMMRSVKEEVDSKVRLEKDIEDARMTLSPLELKAMGFLFSGMETSAGTIVTSKLAKEVGITRTVIVNALRKLESAGLIKTKSSGVKGTYIEVLNELVFREFK